MRINWPELRARIRSRVILQPGAASRFCISKLRFRSECTRYDDSPTCLSPKPTSSSTRLPAARSRADIFATDDVTTRDVFVDEPLAETAQSGSLVCPASTNEPATVHDLILQLPTRPVADPLDRKPRISKVRARRGGAPVVIGVGARAVENPTVKKHRIPWDVHMTRVCFPAAK